MSIKNTFMSVALAACLWATGAHAVTGTLTAATANWTGSVDVTGNVVVPAGVTLTINPGARVRGVGGNFTITANGPVKAVGSLASYIDLFNVNFILNNAGSQHDMEFCVMLTSADAILVQGADAKLAHIQIQDFGTNGVNISGAGAHVALSFCTIGAKSRLFGGNPAYSVNVAGGADQANVDISNSILGFENKDIQVGLAIRGAGNAAVTSATVKVNYCLITGTRIGMGSGEAGVITGTNSDVKDIPNLDYHLWPYSAAINAADPAADFSAEPMPNGGRADMGYYGGTAEATPFQFKIVAPNGGDSLAPGSASAITWQGGKLLGAKKLELSVDSGATWQSIAASVDAAGTGTYAWTVPAVKSPRCLVRVSLAASALGQDVSDRAFTIGDTVGATSGGGTLKDPTPFRCIPFTAYHDGQAPGGAEPSQAEVQADLDLIKPYTREIRTYGSGSSTHGYTLPGLLDKMGMKIHLGIWLDDTYAEATNQQSITDGITLANQNHPSIKTLIVGNEFLLRVRQSHGDVVAAEAKLVRYIKQVKAAVPTNIIVGTGESYPDWLAASDNLVNAVDKVIWHVHPWWEQKAIADAANHAFNVYNQMKARLAKFPNKPMVMGETGWPTAATTGAAVGSEENQAKYFHDLHAWAKPAGLDYWFFTNVDEKWKGAEGAVGAHWGMWNTDRTPKYIITHLNDLIAPANYWSNDNTVTGIVRADRVNALRTVSSDLRIYDLQGRLIGGFGPGGKNLGIDANAAGRRNAAQIVFLKDGRARL